MELNNKYYLDDIETGEWHEVSKEEHDAHIALLKSFADRAIEYGYKPVCYFAGTMDDNSFESLWKESFTEK